MGLNEIVVLSLVVGLALFFVFLMVKSDADKGKPYVRDMLQEIKNDKKIFPIVKAISTKGYLTEKEIIEMSGARDRSIPLYILFLGSHNYRMDLTLGPLPPNLPAVIYKDGDKIKIRPEWLKIIEKANLADWDIKKIKLPRC